MFNQAAKMCLNVGLFDVRLGPLDICMDIES